MLNEDEIKQILVGQREIFFKKNYGVEREILKIIEKKLKLPHVIVLTGMRRSGKSTILRQMAKKFYKDEDFYYINFEDERLINFEAKNFNSLYEVLVALYGRKKTFFIDEIQNVAGFETFVRRFYEEGFKFFITGSSATLLSRELGTKLTGRHLDIVVRPFSFIEFLKLNNIGINGNDIYLIEKKVDIKNLFNKYLVNGGMPEYVLFEDIEILSRIYEDTVIKDIAVRHKVENLAVLRQLYSYLVSNFASKFSYNSLKAITSINSVNTIKKFIGYLEETYFAKTINKFDYSYKKQIINDKKFYLLDNGFINALSKNLTKEKGWFLENLVLSNLNRDDEVFYYANGAECDFLTAKNRKVYCAIQVCYELNDSSRKRELEGLESAMEYFKLKDGLILTNNQTEDLVLNGKKIKVMPVWKWLLERE
ncbi:MAG: ATP-binding protein [Nanoarchaeota archaeon]